MDAHEDGDTLARVAQALGPVSRADGAAERVNFYQVGPLWRGGVSIDATTGKIIDLKALPDSGR